MIEEGLVKFAPYQQGEVGRRINDLRTRRGWSLEDLASRAGVDRSHVSKLERGIYSAPRPETLRKVASALEVPVESLLYGDVRQDSQFDPKLRALMSRIADLPERDRDLVVAFLERAVDGLFASAEAWREKHPFVGTRQGKRR